LLFICDFFSLFAFLLDIFFYNFNYTIIISVVVIDIIQFLFLVLQHVLAADGGISKLHTFVGNKIVLSFRVGYRYC